MNTGMFPKKERNHVRKEFTQIDFREMERKLQDELYIQAAIYRLATILCEHLLNMSSRD
ncbi:MAG: hypothetical protein ACTTH7_05430 [Treponema sp.]